MKKKNKRKYEIVKLIPFYKKYLKLLIATVVFSGLYALFSFFGTFFKGKLLDSFTNFSLNNTLIIAGILCGVMLVVEVVIHIWSEVVLKLNSSVDFDLKHKVLKNLMRLKVKNFDTINSGVFIARLNKDTSRLSELFDEVTDDLSTILINVSFIVYSFFINIWLALFLLANVVFLYFYENQKIKRFLVKHSKFKELDEQVVGSYSEVVRGIRDIKTLNAKDAMLERVDKEQYDSITAHKEEIHLRRSWNRVREGIKHVLDLAFVGLACYLIVSKNITIGDFLVLYVYKSNIMSFVGSMANLKEKLGSGEVSAQRVFEIIENETFEKENFGDIELKEVVGQIEFKNVGFSYTDSAELFKNINFVVKPNSIVAFVGKSGEGKSTIIDLINKNYGINKGQILIDGVDINQLTEETIRNNISVVSQSPYIFNMTIEDNLKLVKPNATKKEIVDACSRAGIHEFIKNLPEKYSSIIGENGVMLSGGQKQRLAIARALLKKSKIILLDEATSALDNETQDKISSTIKEISKDHTIIMVAHRLSTIINSDVVYVLNKHSIETFGTHKELLEKSETYRNLYNSFSE